MRWLGIIAAVCTLAAVILNIIWFARRGGMSARGFFALSVPTVLYLLVFLAAVFAIAWLSGRLLVLLDTREPEEGPDDRGGSEDKRDGGEGEGD